VESNKKHEEEKKIKEEEKKKHTETVETVKTTVDKYVCGSFDRKCKYCFLIYKPVCGYKRDCSGNNCFVQYGNNCVACQHKDIEYTVNGTCPEIIVETPVETQTKIKCSFESGKYVLCSTVSSPVCGYKKSKDQEGATFSNSCMACSAKGIKYFVEGECHSETETETETVKETVVASTNTSKFHSKKTETYGFDACDDEERGIECVDSEDDVAVCGWKIGKQGALVKPYGDYKSRCRACSDKKNIGVIAGKCKKIDRAAVSKNFYGHFDA